MANIICHCNGRYNIYSTVSDSFWYNSSISLKQLTHVIIDLYGNQGYRELHERVNRAHKYGTSAISRDSLEDLLTGNRAGKDEQELSAQECIDIFLS